MAEQLDFDRIHRELAPVKAKVARIIAALTARPARRKEYVDGDQAELARLIARLSQTIAALLAAQDKPAPAARNEEDDDGDEEEKDPRKTVAVCPPGGCKIVFRDMAALRTYQRRHAHDSEGRFWFAPGYRLEYGQRAIYKGVTVPGRGVGHGYLNKML
jgi:hypothetical protein